MPAPSTTEEFLELITKSGVADEARVKSFLLRISPTGEPPADPSQVAGIMVREGVLTYFQANQLLQGKWKRFSIGKYKVLERLGSGGMGQVFLCEHKLMRRRVAVKVLPAAKAQDQPSLERFYREARAVAALDHPNIVRAYDIDQDDNLHFLVMEYVDGTNLQDLIKNFGPLDPLRAAHYIYGAAVGLQHAHEMGLVHRDIKPGNILIDRSGVVKILDMGLARFFRDDEDQLTKKYDENILGTADYLSPEQAIDSHAVDIRADIYSLGGTFYYLLTGRPPFPEGSVAQKLLWHQTREPAPVRQVRPELAPELAEVVARMMAKDPARRYQTPAEVMSALSGWVQSPISPPEEREMPQLSPAVAAGSGGGTITSRLIASSPTMVTGPLQSSGVVPAVAAERGGDFREGARGPLTPATAITPVPVATPAPADVWDEITSETRPNFRGDTDEPHPAPRAPAPDRTRDGRPRPSSRPNRHLALLVAAGVLGLAALAGAAAAVYFVFLGGRTTTTPAGASGIWYVSERDGPDPAHTVRSLRTALDRADSGDTIVILDDAIKDPPFTIADPRGTRRGVSIRAGTASGVVVWTPNLPALSSPALRLTNVDGLKVSGLVFDLQGRSDSAVWIEGDCPGVVVENVTVKNPRSAGFQFVAVRGESARPAQLKNCRVLTDGKLEVGIHLTGGNQHVGLHDNRIEGPGETAIKIEGVAQNVVVENNRIYQFENGLYLTASKLGKDVAYSLAASNNTFYDITASGVLVEPSLDGVKQTFDLQRNYFARTAAIYTTAAPVKGFKQIDNASDGLSKAGKLPPKSYEVIKPELPTPDPANDRSFLRPPDGPLKLRTSGIPVGYLPRK